MLGLRGAASRSRRARPLSLRRAPRNAQACCAMSLPSASSQRHQMLPPLVRWAPPSQRSVQLRATKSWRASIARPSSVISHLMWGAPSIGRVVQIASAPPPATSGSFTAIIRRSSSQNAGSITAPEPPPAGVAQSDTPMETLLLLANPPASVEGGGLQRTRRLVASAPPSIASRRSQAEQPTQP